MKTGAVICITVAATLAAVTAGVLAQFSIAVDREAGSVFLLSHEQAAVCEDPKAGGCRILSLLQVFAIHKAFEAASDKGGGI